MLLSTKNLAAGNVLNTIGTTLYVWDSNITMEKDSWEDVTHVIEDFL